MTSNEANGQVNGKNQVRNISNGLQVYYRY